MTLQALIFVATMAPIRLLFHALYLDGQVAFVTSIFPDDDLDDDMDEPDSDNSESVSDEATMDAHEQPVLAVLDVDDYGQPYGPNYAFSFTNLGPVFVAVSYVRATWRA